MKKTLWQKIYSFFGFWTYITRVEHVKRYEDDTYVDYKVLYWCCFPFWYIRKFDLFGWKVIPKARRLTDWPNHDRKTNNHSTIRKSW